MPEMSPTETAFESIDGVPVYYARATGEPQPATWYCTSAFYDSLTAWVHSLKWMSGEFGGDRYGELRHLVSAGFFVNKPGEHGLGQAMDLDVVQWERRDCSPYEQDHEAGSRERRRLYLAVDASCRRFFRYVIDGFYDAAHQDHLHADFGGLPLVLQRGSSSDTNFVQAVCNEFLDAGLEVDGSWNAATEEAWQRSRELLQMRKDPTEDPEAWRNWLYRLAAHGLADEDLGSFTWY